MAAKIHMPAYQEPKQSPVQDTSDLFGDDDADTNSESEDFEEVSIPNGVNDSKPAPEVVNVDDEEGEDEDEEDDFLPSRVNKYAPANERNGPGSATATAAANPPPTKRRRTETPPPKQPPATTRSNTSHPAGNGPPGQHGTPPPPTSGPYMPTYFNSSSRRNEPLAPSIINSEPLDEFSQAIADWIEHFTQGVNPDHVEASF
ncbi:hypothetical protein RhiJN_05583 [Ceratobasidium sp. AG-Ba]|nr:hypothetical protein RhiJN_05583 [Ceratobasidium sp. AG-Ba]QRW06515.1 hypothetical protein RhiLY_05514 [Ceratobasidium sp. AG-Ba]